MADKKLILPGIPDEPDPKAGIALPLMRGFACPVVTPFMDQGGPSEGIGCGWSNVAGQGVKFFVTIHAEGGFAMIAQLDVARYMRFAENYAAIGKQALVTGHLDEVAPNDPLKALAVAHEALTKAADIELHLEGHDQRRFHSDFLAINEARDLAAKALMLDEGE